MLIHAALPPQYPVPCMACAGPHGVGGRRSPRGHPARPVRRDGVGFRGNTLRSYAVRSLPPAGDVWGRQGHCPWILALSLDPVADGTSGARRGRTGSSKFSPRLWPVLGRMVWGRV